MDKQALINCYSIANHSIAVILLPYYPACVHEGSSIGLHVCLLMSYIIRLSSDLEVYRCYVELAVLSRLVKSRFHDIELYVRNRLFGCLVTHHTSTPTLLISGC